MPCYQFLLVDCLAVNHVDVALEEGQNDIDREKDIDKALKPLKTNTFIIEVLNFLESNLQGQGYRIVACQYNDEDVPVELVLVVNGHYVPSSACSLSVCMLLLGLLDLELQLEGLPLTSE